MTFKPTRYRLTLVGLIFGSLLVAVWAIVLNWISSGGEFAAMLASVGAVLMFELLLVIDCLRDRK